MAYVSSLQNGIDEFKPSLFELLSEQQLSALIPPSIRYLLTLATHRRPRYLLRIFNSFDELYALLSLLVERYYLRNYGGSFTENFYGLKRERTVRIRGGEAQHTRIHAPEILRETLQLRTTDVWKNLALLVGLPYLKRKLDEGLEIYGASPAAVIQMGPNYRRDDFPLHPTIRQKLFWYYKWFLRKIYPSINAAYYFSLLAFNLAYLFDHTQHSSPFLWLIGVRIRRLSEADYRAIALANASQPPSPKKSGANARSKPGFKPSILSPTKFASFALPHLLGSLKILLPTSIFALKFLEWWHASDFARQLSKKSIEGLELPPPVISGLPPSNASRLEDRDSMTSSHNKLSNPLNSVALSTDSSTATGSISDSSVSTQPTSVNPSPQPIRETTVGPPISSINHLPIHTVPPPTQSTSALCPICRHPIQTPTSAQTGYVFCYTCIFKWVDGSHERQLAFMSGQKLSAEWGEDPEEGKIEDTNKATDQESREGEWDSGKGRCAVTGRRVLGGTDGLRRVMV